jgi:acetolactate synthase-1/2/3 large subunit
MGVLWGKAGDGLRRLVEQLGAPLLTTAKAKGVVSEDHPLRAGTLIGGLIEREIVGRADLIVAVGLDAVELQPKPWPYTAPVLALENSASLDAVIPASLELVGALGPLTASLAQHATAGTGWGEAAARAYRGELADALDLPGKGLSPHRLVEVARAALPRDTIATVDSGAHRLLVVQKWDAYEPRGLLSSNGLATMGYAIPSALGARLVHPERPIVAFTGDGGFLMAIAELATAVQEELPIVVVVFVDQEIGQIRVKQEIKGLPRHGIGLGSVDYAKLAGGLGAEGVEVDSEVGLTSALKVAVASGRVTVIGARIDPSTYVEQFNALREL